MKRLTALFTLVALFAFASFGARAFTIAYTGPAFTTSVDLPPQYTGNTVTVTLPKPLAGYLNAYQDPSQPRAVTFDAMTDTNIVITASDGGDVFSSLNPAYRADPRTKAVFYGHLNAGKTSVDTGMGWYYLVTWFDAANVLHSMWSGNGLDVFPVGDMAYLGSKSNQNMTPTPWLFQR